MIKIGIRLVFLFSICLNVVYSAESTENLQKNQTSQVDDLANKKATLSFSVTNDNLKQNSSADEILWVDVGPDKHIILKHRTKGRKERGNILLFHAQGEHPDHIRLIQPLSKQLAQLGWNLFIPNLALEDFPKTAIEEKIKSQSNNIEQPAPDSENQNDFAFNSSQAYQDYFLGLCKAVFDQTEISKMPVIVIANQNTAYWSLQCLNIVNQSTPVIFLQPQLPIGVNDNLADTFEKQSGPVFSFHSDKEEDDLFSDTFKKRLWHSKLQRTNLGMISSAKLQEENTLVARTITGWFDKQRKSN